MAGKVGKKFNFTLDDDMKEVIRLAAEYLGIDMVDVFRIGGYRFANIVLDGKVDFLMQQDLKKLVE